MSQSCLPVSFRKRSIETGVSVDVEFLWRIRTMEMIVFWVMVGMLFMLGATIVERALSGELWTEEW
jgi:hypothetical protein